MSTLAAAQRLTAALDAVAVALAAADTEGLLAAEECLSSALVDLTRVRSVNAAERHGVAGELARAHAVLAGCRVLGRSAIDATNATLLALGRRSPDYGRGGTEMPDPTDVGARGVELERSM
jgi:hypothetical protein